MSAERKPVITTDRGAEVCQKCLVKWARNTVPSPKRGRQFLCNRCYAKWAAE